MHMLSLKQFAVIFSIATLLALPALVRGQATSLGCRTNPARLTCFEAWRSAFTSGTYSADADMDGNGSVTLSDFEVWRRAYTGSSNPTPTTQNPSPSPTVPIGVTLTMGPTVPPTGNKITYTSSLDDIANPERGFMKQSSIFVDQPLDPSKIIAKMPSDTVVWIYFHLDNYRDPRDGKGVTLTNYQGKLLEPIGSGKGLDTVNNAFAEARKKGLKLVIRFLYLGYPGLGSTQDPAQMEPDAPLDLVRGHINQLSPFMQQNKDVIVAVQTGFVGYWGEWHSSKYLGSLANRKAVTDALLAAVPKDRMVQIRYPRYTQLWYGGPLTDSNAFNQSDLARMALHDDAFLKDDTDDGTFKSNTGGVKITNYCDGYPGGEIACWRNFFNSQSRFVAVGGEAGTHSSTPSQFALCPNALIQLSNMHFSFLNNGYAKVVLDSWVAQGCMPEIRRRLGYRYELKEATLPTSVKAGSVLNLNVTLKNVGFANMFNPRPIFLVLLGGNRFEIPLSGVDPRRWARGADSTISQSVSIPSNVAPGTYKLGLWLPDAAGNLRNNPAYSVRFANTNVWDASLGTNVLTPTFTVQP